MILTTMEVSMPIGFSTLAVCALLPVFSCFMVQTISPMLPPF
ncbi:MAG: hypothetical protein ACTTH7_04455 [Treponema sp.]